MYRSQRETRHLSPVLRRTPWAAVLVLVARCDFYNDSTDYEEHNQRHRIVSPMEEKEQQQQAGLYHEQQRWRPEIHKKRSRKVGEIVDGDKLGEASPAPR